MMGDRLALAFPFKHGNDGFQLGHDFVGVLRWDLVEVQSLLHFFQHLRGGFASVNHAPA